jgi:hypothetical protein
MSALIRDHPSLRLNLPAQPGNPIVDEALYVIPIDTAPAKCRRSTNSATDAKERADPTRVPARRAAHFMLTLGIATPAELRQADHKAVIVWERFMRETEHAAASTIRRHLAALSWLYKHPVRQGHARA